MFMNWPMARHKQEESLTNLEDTDANLNTVEGGFTGFVDAINGRLDALTSAVSTQDTEGSATGPWKREPQLNGATRAVALNVNHEKHRDLLARLAIDFRVILRGFFDYDDARSLAEQCMRPIADHVDRGGIIRKIRLRPDDKPADERNSLIARARRQLSRTVERVSPKTLRRGAEREGIEADHSRDDGPWGFNRCELGKKATVNLAP